jgi:hypothetical protein
MYFDFSEIPEVLSRNILIYVQYIEVKQYSVQHSNYFILLSSH